MKILNKIISSIAIFAVLFFQMLTPLQVIAQETSPTATDSATPTPTTAVSPAPTDTTTPTPTDTITAPVSTDSAKPAPSNDTSISSNTSPDNQANAPPTSIPTPTVATTDATPTTPTITNETSDPNVNVNVTVLKNTKASSVTLDLNPSNTDTSATLTTDKADYAPTDAAIITGSGLTPNTTYTLVISSDDPPATHTETAVTTSDKGTFVYSYQLDGNYRPNYLVVLKDLSGNVIATTSFMDSPPTIKLYTDSGHTNEDYQFALGDTVYAQGTSLDITHGYKFDVKNLSGSVIE